MDENYHIGREIKKHIETNGIKIGWLCQQLHCHRNTIYNIYERKWIDTQMLMRISKVLKRDFFAEFSQYYQEHKTEDIDR